MVEGDTLYGEIIVIAEDYFGPAAPRYIDRLITGHLRKQPPQLQRKDLPELFRWIKLTVAMVTDDYATITEFMNRLGSLQSQKLTKDRG